MIHQLLVSLRKPFLKSIPVPTPNCIVGLNKTADIYQLSQQYKITHALIVCDPIVFKLGLMNPMLDGLTTADISYTVFNDVEPDPDYTTIRNGVDIYKQNCCDGIIAFGGGSAIDCAKAIGASVKTGKDINRLPGMLRVHRKLMPIIAVPTTSGTGSECTVAAVVSDKSKQIKCSITDPFLVPKAAVIDPQVTLGLPPQITAETGIDALTHAIESYLSQYSNNYTKQLSIEAIELILNYLGTAVKSGRDHHAREQMACASYKAGLAFTRTYIGYVHAIAHQLGAMYHIPHGRANAMVLIPVLKFYHDAGSQRLNDLALATGFKDSTAFIQTVANLLDTISIPAKIAELKANDIGKLAKSAISEAFGEYPVPVELNTKQCEQILQGLLETDSNSEGINENESCIC